jgi:hypothetical protein
MAGEWLPYDVCLPQKPEVLELVDRTGLSVDQVVGRLVMLWGWASLNSSDGTARMSVRLLSKVCGGDEVFWSEVEAVGWLVIDAENGTVAIPGWDRRFSKSAKSRDLAKVRHEVDKTTRPRRGRDAPPRGALRAPEEREEREEKSSSSSHGDAALEEADTDRPADWGTLRAAWEAAVQKRHATAWKLQTPPDRLLDRLEEPGWFDKAIAAIGELPRCRYFQTPVTLPQLVGPGFVDKVLGGQFDNPRERPRGPARPDDRPPAQAWTGEEAAAFERTKRLWAEKLKQEGAA